MISNSADFDTKQPQGLWVLFITEMWERFSYYGMRALLVLYLIASTNSTVENSSGEMVANTNPGFGWDEASAAMLFAVYTWAVYFTPIFGGYLADRFLGTHRSMLLGGWFIAAGHITLAGTEFFGVTAGEVVSLQTSPGALITFVTGLGLIVIGTGFFKPCVSVMVGQLYGPDDHRRDSGFTIFYMGINLGGFLRAVDRRHAGTESRLALGIRVRGGRHDSRIVFLSALSTQVSARCRFVAKTNRPARTRRKV